MIRHACRNLRSAGRGLYLFTLNPEGEPARIKTGLRLQPRRILTTATIWL